MIRLAWKPLRRRWVAIDYDSRQVRLVVFDCVGGQAVIRSLHVADVPRQVNPSDAGALGRHLKLLADRLGLGGCRAIMCVGRSQVVLKSLLLPPGAGAGEMPAMVQFQIAKELPFSSDEAVVDFTIGAHWDSGQTEELAEGVMVLAAAVRLPVLEAARSICAEAGLRLEHLVFRPHANLRSVSRCVQFAPSERVLFVNVTADEAEIDVISEQALEFSRAARISGGSLNNGVAGNGRAGDAAANGSAGGNGKTGVGGAPAVEVAPAASEPSQGELSERRQAAVKRALAEVDRSLAGFNATQRGGQISACLVAGNTGLEDELTAAIGGALGIRCERFDPSGGYGIVSDEQAPGFSAALGMAAVGAGDEPPFDFLRPKRPVPPRNVRRTQLAVVGGAAALMLLGGVLAGWLYLGALKSELKELDGQYAKLTSQRNQLLPVQMPLKQVGVWQSGDVEWLDQLAHLSNTLPPAEQVYVQSFRTLPGTVAKPGGPVPCGIIALSGRSKDADAMSEFTKRLMAMAGYEPRPQSQSPVRGERDPNGYNSEFKMDIQVLPQAKPVLAEAGRTVGRPADDAGGEARPPRVRPTQPPAQPAGQNPAQPQPTGGAAAKPAQPSPTVIQPGPTIIQPGPTIIQPSNPVEDRIRRRRGGTPEP